MKKIVKILGVLLLLVFLAALAVPYLFKDKIVEAIKKAANENLNATLSFDNDIDISLIKSFPNLSIGIHNLSLANAAPFEGDTLIALKDFQATLDLMSVINGERIEIRRIFLDEARVHVIVTRDGKANYDISKPSTDSTAADTGESEFNIALKEYSLQKSHIIYDDQSLGFYMEMKDLDHKGNGDFTEELFTLKTTTSSKEVSLAYGGVKYLSKVNTDLKADLDMDMKNFKFTFKENELRLNELFLGMDGWLAMPADDIDMDLKFNAEKTDFKNILSLVPAIYAKDFDKVKTSGKLALDGMVKGTYNEKQMPAFALNLLVENGMFRYPDLPVAVNNVAIKLNVNNPDGVDDHTVIDLSKFHIELGQEPFDATLLMKTPVSDPFVKASLSGKLDLGNVSKLMPLEEGMKIAGVIVSDFAAEGHTSAIEKGQYDQFQASGKISASQIVFSSKDLKQPFRMNSALLTFNPRNINLSNFEATIGRTDMKADGTIDNALGYAMKDQTMKGVFNFSSNLIDANEFLSEETAPTQPAAADTVPLEAFEVPANIDFTLNSKIGKLKYDNIELTNVRGTIKVADHRMLMKDVAMNIFNGTTEMSGYYDSKNIKKPEMDMNFKLHNVDIQKLATSFESIPKIMPMAKNTYGNVSADFRMFSVLNHDLSPDLKSVNAAGSLDIPKAVVKDYKPLMKVAEALKMPKYKELAVNNVKINFEIKDGRIYVKPFDVKAGNLNMNVAGSTGLDQSIDYKIATKFPKSELGGSANQAIDELTSKINKQGLDIAMGDIINVDVLMGGTVNNPTVKTSMKDVGKNVKDAVKEELEKKKAEIEAKAREEAEKAKQKALEEADKAKAEAEAKAKAELEKIKKEAEKKKKEAEAAAKKKAEEEAKKKLKGLKF